MMTRLPLVFLAGALLLPTAALPMPDKKDSNMASKDKMSGSMDGMSTADKAAMFDKMPDKEKNAAMKMAGHDMSKMSPADRMSMMEKMSAEDKAAAVDKMHMSKSKGKMSGDKMDKMDKK